MKTFKQITKETVLKSEKNKIFQAGRQFSNHTVYLLLNIKI